MANNNKNYFETNIQRFGEDFLDFKRVDELQRDARYIFRDIIYGNINYEKHGIYFTDPRFLEQLIIVSNIKLEEHSIKFNALVYYNQALNETNATALNLIESERNICFILKTINDRLNFVKCDNYNIAHLTYLPALLKPYKKYFNNY